MMISDYIALGVFYRLNHVGRGGSGTACDRSQGLAIGLNSRSAIRNWRGITNRISGAARIAKRASDQNGGVGSSARLEPVGFFVTSLDAMGLIGWRRKRKAQAV